MKTNQNYINNTYMYRIIRADKSDFVADYGEMEKNN